MPRKKSNLPKWTGILAKPIDTKVVMNFALGDKAIDDLRTRHHAKLREVQCERLIELGRQLGLKPPRPDNRTASTKLNGILEYAGFCQVLAIHLAARFGIPGFQVVKPKKWSPELVIWATVFCERRKVAQLARSPRSKWSDLPVCLEIVKVLHPEMSKNANRKTAISAARQLRNRVSKQRAIWKREHRAREIREAQSARPPRLH